jgi:hypothetical protein
MSEREVLETDLTEALRPNSRRAPFVEGPEYAVPSAEIEGFPSAIVLVGSKPVKIARRSFAAGGFYKVPKVVAQLMQDSGWTVGEVPADTSAAFVNADYYSLGHLREFMKAAITEATNRGIYVELTAHPPKA